MQLSMFTPLIRKFLSLSATHYKRRIALLSLFALVSTSLYIIGCARHLASPMAILSQKHASMVRVQVNGQKSYRTTQRTQFRLSAAQELAAVSSFLASLPQNTIPSFVDPLHPIDPQLVLDFDTRGSRAKQEIQAMVVDVWAMNPVLLYSKEFSTASREIKGLLKGLNLHPPPTIIDVDVRDNADVLIALLSRLTGVDDLPVLIVGGKVVGNATVVRYLEKSGGLWELIGSTGAVIDGNIRKNHA